MVMGRDSHSRGRGFESKVTGNFGDCFEKHQFKVKPAVATFWATFGKMASSYFNNWSHCS